MKKLDFNALEKISGGAELDDKLAELNAKKEEILKLEKSDVRDQKLKQIEERINSIKSAEEQAKALAKTVPTPENKK